MADGKLTSLPELTAAVATDQVYVVDTSDTTDDPAGSSRRLTLTNLASAVGAVGNFVVEGTQNVHADAYDAAGGTDLGGGAVVALDTARTVSGAGADFTLSGGVLTYNAGTDLFVINASVSTDTGGGRDSSAFRLERSTDGGATWSEVPGTRGYMYNRTSGNGESSGASTCLLTLNAGDQLRLWGWEINAAGPVTTIANGSRLTVVNARGGSVGPEGPAGSVDNVRHGDLNGVTVSTSAPSGGQDGDVWFQV